MRPCHSSYNFYNRLFIILKLTVNILDSLLLKKASKAILLTIKIIKQAVYYLKVEINTLGGLLFSKKAINFAPFFHVHILFVVVHLGPSFLLHVSLALVILAPIILVVVHLAPVFHVHVLLATGQPNSAFLFKHIVSASIVLEHQDSSSTRLLHGQVVDCVSYKQSGLFVVVHLGSVSLAHINLVVVHLAVFHVQVLIGPGLPNSAFLLKHMVSASSVLEHQDSSMAKLLAVYHTQSGLETDFNCQFSNFYGALDWILDLPRRAKKW